MLEETYKGVRVYYNEHREKFVAEFSDCVTGQGEYANKSLQKVRQYVDRVLKKEFKQFPALIRRWHLRGSFYDDAKGLVVKVTVTSVTPDGDVWIRRNGRREKCNSPLYRYTKANAKKIQTITKLNEKRKKLDDTITKKWNGLQTVDVEKLARKAADGFDYKDTEGGE